MFKFFRKLFVSDFMPHGACYFWKPGGLWRKVVGDSWIAQSSYGIPLFLFALYRRRRASPTQLKVAENELRRLNASSWLTSAAARAAAS